MTNTLPKQAKVMIGMVAVASLCPLSLGVINWHMPAWPQFALLLTAAALTSRLKVKLPGMTSTMSGNLPVILLAVTQLGLFASLLVAVTAAVAQSFGSGKQVKPVQFLFNTCTLMNASALAYAVYHSHLLAGFGNGTALALVAASAVYFLANTAPVAGIIGLTESNSPFAIWHKVFLWSFPNYVMGAGLSAIASLFGTGAGMVTVGALMLVLFGVYKSYEMFVAQTEQTAPKALAMAAGR
ncbi:MAG: hypothetical protein ACLP3R_21110 [Candidatus Korobacteraceae bacterium]